jgi:osmotically-inducible protein OsmY
MCGEGPVSAPVVEVSDGVVRLSGVATDYVAASARVASTVPGVVRVEVDASVTGPR